VNNLIRKILRESLLLENRVDTVFEKYRNKHTKLFLGGYMGDDGVGVSDSSLKDLISQISYQLDNKYLDWLVKTYLQVWGDSGVTPSVGTTELLIKTINKFDKNIPKINTNGFKEYLKNYKHLPILPSALNRLINNITDINAYPNFMTLSFVVEESDKYVTPTQKKKIVKQETNKIYEDDDVLIIEPLSEASSCMYGSNTKWCTAATEGQNMFKHYKNNTSTLIYIIGKTDEMVEGKWALHLGYEIALSDDFEYSKYTLYDDSDNDVEGGPYYGKGDLDIPLRTYVGLHDKPYKAIENFYNNRLRDIEFKS
jgi:hypothetical protein